MVQGTGTGKVAPLLLPSQAPGPSLMAAPLLSPLEETSGFPEPLLWDFFQAYQNWRSHHKRILRARPRMNVAVDTSTEKLRAAVRRSRGRKNK